MAWSPLHDGRFYLVLAAGLAGLLILAFRFATAAECPEPGPAGAAGLGAGRADLDLAQP